MPPRTKSRNHIDACPSGRPLVMNRVINNRGTDPRQQAALRWFVTFLVAPLKSMPAHRDLPLQSGHAKFPPDRGRT